MISPEQLAQALDRIHPRDRELLSLSLQRRVPDEALALRTHSFRARWLIETVPLGAPVFIRA